MLNWFLFLILTFTLPITPVAIVTESPGECTVEAVGSVETYLRAYYAHADPNNPGVPYTYTGPTRVLTNEIASVAYDWHPVAYEWWYKPIGELGEPGTIISPDPPPDIVEGEYQLGLVCGDVPSPEYTPPTEDLPPTPDCDATVEGSIETFLRAYYWHEDPVAPGMRFRYTSELVIAENQDVEIELAPTPAAVEWWYRPYGVIHASNGEWMLAKTCGEVPTEVTVMRGVGEEEPLMAWAEWVDGG